MHKFNPFAEEHAAKLRDVEALGAEKSEALRLLVWYRSYDAESESRTLREREAELTAASEKAEVLRADRVNQRTRIDQLVEASRLGLDPRRWFSSERRASSKELAEANESWERTREPLSEAEERATRLQEACQALRQSLQRYRAMDVARIQSRLVDIDASLPALQRALDRLTADKERVDGQLKAPFAELQSLTARRNAIETDIRLADGFERQLNSASSPRERHLIHEECARAFGGESRPGRILQTRRRDLQSVLRNVEKVESRLDRISSMARRVISSVVLDGNNLCYEDQRFVGLSPVIALAYALADRYEVVVVFDAGIRGLTKMNNQQIAFGFPRNSRVHVVATAQAADETILEAASEAGSYVISNDRFRDFTDKAAVSDQRLLRHEIVAGKLFVHDLQVSISFATDHAANPNPEQ